MERKTKEFWLIVLFILSFLAVIDSAYLVYIHYSSSPDTFCTFGANFDCNTASKSVYSTVDNIFYFLAVDLGLSVPMITIPIPIAVMAIAFFLLVKIGVLHIWHEKEIGRFNAKHMLWTLRGLLSFSLIYGIWLMYVQAYILRKFCLYCLILDTLIVLSLIVSFILKNGESSKYSISFKR